MDLSQMAYSKRIFCSTNVAVAIKKKKIISLEITSEEVHYSMMLKNLVNNALENNTQLKECSQ